MVNGVETDTLWLNPSKIDTVKTSNTSSSEAFFKCDSVVEIHSWGTYYPAKDVQYLENSTTEFKIEVQDYSGYSRTYTFKIVASHYYAYLYNMSGQGLEYKNSGFPKDSPNVTGLLEGN